MKTLLLLPLAFLSLHAHAASPCEIRMPCGTFEGTGQWFHETSQKIPGRAYREKIEITAVDETTLNLKVFIYSGATPGAPWTNANLHFSEGGAFTMELSPGLTFGSGFCAEGACTVAFLPVAVKQKGETLTNAFVDILRFEGNKLTRLGTSTLSGKTIQLSTQKSELIRK